MRLVGCSKCRKIITLPDGSRKYLCRACSTEAGRQWRIKNREWFLVITRSRRNADKRRVNEYFRNYYRRNRKKILEKQRADYKTRFPDIISKYNEHRKYNPLAIYPKIKQGEKENFYKAFENWMQP